MDQRTRFWVHTRDPQRPRNHRTFGSPDFGEPRKAKAFSHEKVIRWTRPTNITSHAHSIYNTETTNTDSGQHHAFPSVPTLSLSLPFLDDSFVCNCHGTQKVSIFHSSICIFHFGSLWIQDAEVGPLYILIMILFLFFECSVVCSLLGYEIDGREVGNGRLLRLWFT